MAAHQRVLFLCTHNSVRSQMAEGWLRYLDGDRQRRAAIGRLSAGVRCDSESDQGLHAIRR
jgi:protein-tyrosine-phosphatase